MTSRVVVSVTVPCSPIQAFTVFTEEIGDWWADSTLFRFTPRSPGRMAFDGSARLVEVLPDGKMFEVGQVKAWAPGERLVVGWRQASFGPEQATEVEVRFEALQDSGGAKTRVTVEHRGWDTVPQAHKARHGFPLQLFLQRQGEQWRDGLARLEERIDA